MAAGVYSVPSGQNVVVPDIESTNNLKIEFTRNEKKFALNQYCQIVPVGATQGFYMEMNVEQAGRILTSGEDVWPDGSPAPKGIGQAEQFRYLDYRCIRYAPTVSIGKLTQDQAPWDIAQQQLRILAQKQMTRRTSAAVTALTTSGNYAASHTVATSAISGVTGNWAAATAANQNIKRSLMYAMDILETDTLSSINPDDFTLILSPNLAGKLSVSGEISDYMKGSPFASPVIKGDWAGIGSRGLPERLYGVKVVIENAAYTSTRRGATTSKSYLMGNAVAALIARPGSLEAKEGPTFSTLSMFVYKDDDMTVETIHNEVDRTSLSRVVDNFDVKMTAPVSGFLFTSCQ